MTDPRSVVRGILVYALCLPLALVVGYNLAGLSDLRIEAVLTVGLVLGFLLFPILLRWHHPLLICSWNTIAVLFFIPGRPQIRLALAAASLLITLLMYALDRRAKPQIAASISWPLLFLVAVVLITAELTGGAGFGSFGSQIGGAGRYVTLLGAILGYFAISARPIPVEKAPLYVGLFLLGGVTLVISGLAPYCPQSLQFIFLLFPVDRVLFAVQSPTASGMSRLYGVAVSCMFGVFFMLARFGIRGIFSSTKPWRALVFLGFVMGVMLGGFRAFMLLTTGVFLVQFYLEGLLKMRFLPAWLVLGAFVVSLLPIADRLPYQMQRSLAWIPGIVSPEVAYDARGSTEWRLAIWRRALDELPQHLILGKGYALDLRDMAMVQYRQRALGGESEMGEAAELAGDYHSGPLTIVMPFGIFGLLGVVWFWVAGWRLLLHNYRYGLAELKTFNTLLLALFVTRVFHFLVIFGSLSAEFAHFTGLVGLSMALNHGFASVHAPAPAAEPAGPTRRRSLPAVLPSPVAAQTKLTLRSDWVAGRASGRLAGE